MLLPNGISTIFGPVSARIHDVGGVMLMSGLDDFLWDIQLNIDWFSSCVVHCVAKKQSGTSLRVRRLVPIFCDNLRPAGMQKGCSVGERRPPKAKTPPPSLFFDGLRCNAPNKGTNSGAA